MDVDGKDPKIDIEPEEEDQYIESLIVYNGKLTSYGQQLYDDYLYEQYYDEESRKWIWAKIFI